ncbi:MAG: DUF1080 domain-containing protein [Solitalea sp.]
MKLFLSLFATAAILASCATSSSKNNAENDAETSGEWISLFDGETLDGWKAGENPSTFSVEDGAIKVAGPRAHLFYQGPVMNHDFKNFEFKARVMTTPGSNSGIYFHTAYQDEGWPSKGYEVQVNNSHTDWRRTGSLYGIDDVKEVHVQDNEWYTEHIIVRDKHIVVKINDLTVVDYIEPDSVAEVTDLNGRRISSGTFALQGHDPESVVYFKDIQVKPLD